MKFKATLLMALMFTGSLFAQIVVTNTETPEDLVNNVLLGNGVVVSNITLNGTAVGAQTVNVQMGRFNKDTTDFPLDHGIVLSTGNVNTLPGSSSGFISTSTNAPGDPDLAQLSGVNINDAVVLEFDFVAKGDSMAFHYMFGSEEYPQFVGGGVNDAFGFFLSGPGINGPFSNNAKNIALIPGTNTGVSINTVNAQQNSNFYVNNQADTFGITTQLNAYTTVMAAASGLQCEETYHIKIAIGDGGDRLYDSAVFLEGNSFEVKVVDISLPSSIVGTATDSIMAEGCASLELNLVRNSHINDSLVFHLTYSGTADSSDFVGFTDSIIFLPGEDSLTMLFTPTPDGITEMLETLQLKGYSINQCGDTIYDSVIMYIADQYYLSFDLEDTVQAVCLLDTSPVEVTNLINSVGPYSFLWSFGDTTAQVNLPNNGVYNDTITHVVTVTDGCGTEFKDSVVLLVDSLPPSILFLPINQFTATCYPDTQFVNAMLVDSTLAPYNWQWSHGQTTPDAFFVPDSTNFDTTYYVLTLMDGCGFEVKDSVRIDNDFEVPNFQISPNDTIIAPCPSTIVPVDVVQQSGVWGPWSHSWSNGDSGSSVFILNTGVNGDSIWYYATTTNACDQSSIDSVLVINRFIQPAIEFSMGDTIYLDCLPDSEFVQVLELNGAHPSFTYEWDNGETGAGRYLSDQGMNNTSYPFSVTLTDGCGFTTTRSGEVQINQTLSIDSLHSFKTQYCVPTGIVEAFVSGETPSANGVRYQWNGPDDPANDSIDAQRWEFRPYGMYYFTVTDSVCSITDSILVDSIPAPFADGDAEPSVGEIPLDVIFSNYSLHAENYFWNFGGDLIQNTASLDPISVTYTKAGLYEVILVADPGTLCADTLYFYIDAFETTFDTPNVFTPNGDGANDVWTMNVEHAKNVDLFILNRWGDVVYSESGKNPQWDGRAANGDEVSEGVYYFKYHIESPKGKLFDGAGFFHLVR